MQRRNVAIGTISNFLQTIASDDEEDEKPTSNIPFSGITIENGRRDPSYRNNDDDDEDENNERNDKRKNVQKIQTAQTVVGRTTINDFTPIEPQKQQQNISLDDTDIFFDFDFEDSRKNNNDDDDNNDINRSNTSSISSKILNNKENEYDADEEIKKEFPLTQQHLIDIGILDKNNPKDIKERDEFYKIEEVFIAFANSTKKKRDPSTVHFQERNEMTFWVSNCVVIPGHFVSLG